jgi:hypothetical protein
MSDTRTYSLRAIVNGWSLVRSFRSRDSLLKAISLINIIHQDETVHGVDNIGDSESHTFQDGMDQLLGFVIEKKSIVALKALTAIHDQCMTGHEGRHV